MPVDEVSFLLDSFLPHTSPNATSYWCVTAENDGTSSLATYQSCHDGLNTHKIKKENDTTEMNNAHAAIYSITSAVYEQLAVGVTLAWRF